jgi:hypothetical protein
MAAPGRTRGVLRSVLGITEQQISPLQPAHVDIGTGDVVTLSDGAPRAVSLLGRLESDGLSVCLAHDGEHAVVVALDGEGRYWLGETLGEGAGSQDGRGGAETVWAETSVGGKDFVLSRVDAQAHGAPTLVVRSDGACVVIDTSREPEVGATWISEVFGPGGASGEGL